MNSLWIQKKLEFDEDMIQLTCPFCHDDKFFAHKDNEKMPKYCPMCGARMDDTDASDAELVDMLQDVLKGKDETIEYLRTQLELTTEDKKNLADILQRHLNTEDTILRNWQERANKAEECVEYLEKKLDAKDEQIASLECQLEQAQEEIDKADGYYCSMIDNLRDDIQDLKQQLALSDAACGDVIRTKRKLEEKLFTKHNEYAQLRHEYDLLNSLFEDMKRVMVKVRPSEWAALAKKHNKED